MNKIISAALIAALIAAGCGKGGEAAAEKPADKPAQEQPAAEETAKIESAADLIDFKVGDQWVYSMDQRLDTSEGSEEYDLEMTMKVLDVQKTDEGVTAILETTSTDTQTGQIMGRDVLSWQLTEKGLFQTAVANGEETYNPPLPLVPLPLLDGAVVSHTGTGPREGTDKAGPFQAELGMSGWQEVDTDMGRMKAYSISGFRQFTLNKIPVTSAITVWVAPGHGIVRALSETSMQDSRVTVLRRIKSHTEAKGS